MGPSRITTIVLVGKGLLPGSCRAAAQLGCQRVDELEGEVLDASERAVGRPAQQRRDGRVGAHEARRGRHQLPVDDEVVERHVVAAVAPAPGPFAAGLAERVSKKLGSDGHLSIQQAAQTIRMRLDEVPAIWSAGHVSLGSLWQSTRPTPTCHA